MQVLTRTFTDFVLREARYEPGYAGTEHRHALPYFGCVAVGSFAERTRRGRATYGAGSVHGHPAGDPHAAVVGPAGATCFSILPGEALARGLDAIAGDASPRIAALAAYCRRAFAHDDFATTLDCESVVHELFATALEGAPARERGTPRWLCDARAVLHAHEGGPVSLAALAAIAGVHPAHVARGFRRVLGVTPAAYLRRLRFERACRALVETSVPLATLALDLGYASQSHLTRDFRARLGTTPGAYRRARFIR